MVPDEPGGTEGVGYTERLTRLSGAGWKKALNVQAPYRRNLRRLGLGRVLDVGCGIGRNLAHLDGNGVGVDHNAGSVAAARAAGLQAFTPAQFHASESAGSFDTMLLAHVLEHVDEQTGDALLREYLPAVRPGGRILLITPQESGYRTDATHVRFVDAARAAEHLRRVGAQVDRSYSFPFPRAVGRVFPYNEFVVSGRLPS